MLKNINIGTKITLVVFAMVSFSFIAASFIAFTLSKRALIEKHGENINRIADLKSYQINNFFDEATKNAELVQNLDNIQESYTLIDRYDTLNRDSILFVAESTIEKEINAIQKIYHLNKVVLTDRNYRVVYSNSDEAKGSKFEYPDNSELDFSRDSVTMGKEFIEEGKFYKYVLAPLQNTSSQFSGLLIFRLDLTEVLGYVNETKEISESSEMILGKQEYNRVVFLNQLRFDTARAMSKSIVIGDNKGLPIQLGVAGQDGSAEEIDYRDVSVFSVWRHIPAANWGMVIKLDLSEIYDQAYSMVNKFVIVGIILIILSTLVSLIFSSFLINPIISLKQTLELLSRGILPENIQSQSNDEIGQMAKTTNNLVNALKSNAQFAQYIGKGKYDADFEPQSEEDTLGNALINMRNSIQESEKQDQERNWIVTGQAEIGEILRLHDNLEELGDAVIAYVTNKIKAIQGAFYVVNDDDENNHFIEMQASYAYNKKKYLQKSFKFAEGLVGQAAIEQDTVLRTEIPEDYVTITSGLLGEQRPNCILIVPLITNELVYGALEFAGYQKFNAMEIKFVEEVSLIIARTIFNIKVNERTRMLLSESQQMSNELQEKQEVLRQNAEEMEATQEELKRTNTRLEDQIEEVNRTQKRMQVLLENASEVITIYEADGNVRYISPSVENILGYHQDELIGSSDEQNVMEEDRKKWEKMFKNLLDFPEKPVTLQYAYRKKDGAEVMLEAMGKNLISDAAIQGIVVNSRDITEKLRAEKEERMRSQMQALSENSPDLITRMNNQGDLYYINPVIESYTGKDTNHFLNKNMNSVGLDETIVEEWKKILADVGETNAKISREMDFPSEPLGDRIMQVNAIPEYNEDEVIESVLVVSHDITSRKLIELEIQSKNKKITESINYAQRIQGAILPNNHVVHKALPESFIYYKARDVVSGDFPWFLKKGDNIFIAAVDCTGHGVPGALISLIGYFLLNDIIRSRGIQDPGEALDLLDEGVTQTLRQDAEDAKSKDGMDIALLKINLKENSIEFSGAHRPLYYMKSGEMVEIKGNKFAIGGGIYKNQTNFTNHKIKFKKGDSVYFCSDGFPDQFGGPEGRKFGPKRTRDLIEQVHAKPMDEIHEIFDKEWMGWKGDQKQIDDVLMIGIKF